MENNLKVMVAYATPEKQSVQTLQVVQGSSVEKVLQQSKNYSPFNELDFSQYKVGIFGKEVVLTQEVKNGDRIEIYRKLMMDPMTARRKRAENKNGMT